MCARGVKMKRPDTVAVNIQLDPVKPGTNMYHPAEPTVPLTVVAVDEQWVTVKWDDLYGLPQNSAWLRHQLCYRPT